MDNKYIEPSWVSERLKNADKKTIIDTLAEFTLRDVLDNPEIDDVIQFFTDIKNNTARIYTSMYLEIESTDVYDRPQMVVRGEREETDKEYAARKIREHAEKLRREARIEKKKQRALSKEKELEAEEYKEYLRLKEKFDI